MKRIALIAIPVLVAFVAFSFMPQKPVAEEANGIKWMTWQQMQEAQKKEPRKVFIDVYTDWCGWCKRMDATTFANPEVVKFVNENFYSIKFNAETREAIKFKGNTYNYVPQGYRGYNELAAEILNGQMSYPTSAYLDEQLNVIFPVPGYQDPKTFEQVINFVAGENYKSMQFEEFAASFKGKVQQ